MAPSFADQIKGIPLELVRQGWRREPECEILDNWMEWIDSDPSHDWEGGTTLERYRIRRPVRIIMPTHGMRLCVYDHNGWGNGLSPTPEMCKVWKFWWKDMDGLLMPIAVTSSSDEMFPEYQRNIGHGWRGPVLPTVQ